MRTLQEKKEVRRLADANYYKNNKEKILLKKRKYYQDNKKAISLKHKKYLKTNKKKLSLKKKEYYNNNKQKILLTKKEYHITNKEKISLNKKAYYKKNKKKIRVKRRKYEKNRCNIDPLFRLSKNIRALIRNSLSNNGFKKNSKTAKILGCTFIEFKQHLESQFEPWMNWENYGKYNGELNFGWDIDHIIPTSSVKTEVETVNLNHYTNLRPLCGYTNRYIKGESVI